MASRSVTIPFSGGHDTTIDKRLAGLGKFRRLENGRLDADGRLVARAGYTALATTCYGSGSHVCYDLFELDGRLCSLGDRHSEGHPTDVFEYVEGAGATWKGTGTTSSNDLPRLPRGTRLVEVARPPNQNGGVSGFDVAAVAGFVMLVYNDDATPPNGYAMLVRSGSGQVLRFDALNEEADTPRRFLQAVGLTTRFWVLGLQQDSLSVTGIRIDPATDEAYNASEIVFLSDAAGFSAIAAAKVTGADRIALATVAADGDMVVRVYDDAGTLIVPSGGQYATQAGITNAYIAVEADTSANQLTVAVSDDGALKLFSYNLSTGATLGAPPFTPTEVTTQLVQNIALARSSSTQLQVVASVSDIGTPDVPLVMLWTYTCSTGAFGTGRSVMGTKLTSGAVFLDSGNGTVFGAVTDDATTTPNLLMECGATEDDTTQVPIVAKDLGFASPPVDGTIPRIAVDSSRDPARYYWAHGVQGADGSSIPVLCELALTDPGRRQVARIGRGAVISGAMPCWYDGAQVCELGYAERPVIVSLTGSNGSGELLPEAVYSYRAVHSWFDIFGRQHRSPVSLPVDITMGAAEDTVAAVIAGPHTARHNRGSAPLGSVVRTELYRTRAIVTKTEASIAGTQNVDPPLNVLNGQTLIVFVSDGTGAFVTTVVFGASDDDSTTIAATINTAAGSSGDRFTATAVGGTIVLTSEDEGSAVFMQVNGLTGETALVTLGLTEGQSDLGTTEIERGDVFHLAATGFTVVGGDAGGRISITDVRDDDPDADGLPSQAVLYTQLESPLGDHSPLPSDYVWSGSERLEVAGHPARETYTSSKLVDPSLAPAFAEQGRPGFSGELTESIQAVITQGRSKIYLTRRALWQVDGEGPGTNGKGSFARAVRIDSAGGLVADGWRSLLQTDQGTWAQLGSDKLYLLPPGGAPIWAGFPVRELLRSFPVISGACLTEGDQLAVFALQSEDGTDGRLLLLDTRRSVWMVDDPGVTPVAVADYQGRLCFCDTDGIVYMQDTSAGVGTFVPLLAQTGHATLAGAAGQLAVEQVLLVGELLGECSAQLLVDYDNGGGFVDAGTLTLTVAAGYTVGQTIREEFALALQDCAQFALKVVTSGSSGSAGLALVALEVHAERDAGPALLGDSFRR